MLTKENLEDLAQCFYLHGTVEKVDFNRLIAQALRCLEVEAEHDKLLFRLEKSFQSCTRAESQLAAAREALEKICLHENNAGGPIHGKMRRMGEMAAEALAKLSSLRSEGEVKG